MHSLEKDLKMSMRKILPAVAVAGALVVGGWAAPAQAAMMHPDTDARACKVESPGQIEFIGNTVHKCFGGKVGSLSVNFFASAMHPGGYYGNFKWKNGNTFTRVDFRPTETIGLGSSVLIKEITITPPF